MQEEAAVLLGKCWVKWGLMLHRIQGQIEKKVQGEDGAGISDGSSREDGGGGHMWGMGLVWRQQPAVLRRMKRRG